MTVAELRKKLEELEKDGKGNYDLTWGMLTVAEMHVYDDFEEVMLLDSVLNE